MYFIFYMLTTENATYIYNFTGLQDTEKFKSEPHPVKRTEKKYKVFPASSHSLLAAFYAARQSVCFSIGVRTPRLRWTRLVL